MYVLGVMLDMTTPKVNLTIQIVVCIDIKYIKFIEFQFQSGKR